MDGTGKVDGFEKFSFYPQIFPGIDEAK